MLAVFLAFLNRQSFPHSIRLWFRLDNHQIYPEISPIEFFQSPFFWHGFIEANPSKETNTKKVVIYTQNSYTDDDETHFTWIQMTGSSPLLFLVLTSLLLLFTGHETAMTQRKQKNTKYLFRLNRWKGSSECDPLKSWRPWQRPSLYPFPKRISNLLPTTTIFSTPIRKKSRRLQPKRVSSSFIVWWWWW